MGGKHEIFISYIGWFFFFRGEIMGNLRLVVDNSGKLEAIECLTSPYEGIYSIEAWEHLFQKIHYGVKSKMKYRKIYVDKSEYLSHNVMKLDKQNNTIK